jgi:S-formylglutathione hydrolase FrmB
VDLPIEGEDGDDHVRPGLTRRRLLLSGTAAAIAAAAGVALEQGRRGDEDRPNPGPTATTTSTTGASPPPPTSAPGPRLEEGQLASRHRPTPVPWAISAPAAAPTQVAICLHGRTNDHRFPFDLLGLHDVVDQLGLPLALAAPDGGPHSYWHARRDGTDAMAMLLEEFLPFVRGRFPGAPIALIGWSMGGFGTLLAAERSAPGTFAALAAVSPALPQTFAESTPGAFDDGDDFAASTVWPAADRLAGTPLRIDCGTEDPYITNARAFAAMLEPAPTTSFVPGAHDTTYWRRAAPAQLEWLASAMAS